MRFRAAACRKSKVLQRLLWFSVLVRGQFAATSPPYLHFELFTKLL